MSAVLNRKMSVDEFLAWAEGQEGRYELVDGEVVAIAPEQVRHARIKGSVYLALSAAIRRAGLACEVFPDGMTIRIEETTAYEPDALVRCGVSLPDDALEIPDPVIVVEVLSPSTARHDTGTKLAGYFEVPSIQHYLIVDPVRSIIVHHQRRQDLIETCVIAAGVVRLNPPGLEIGFDEVFGLVA